MSKGRDSGNLTVARAGHGAREVACSGPRVLGKTPNSRVPNSQSSAHSSTQSRPPFPASPISYSLRAPSFADSPTRQNRHLPGVNGRLHRAKCPPAVRVALRPKKPSKPWVSPSPPIPPSLPPSQGRTSTHSLHPICDTSLHDTLPPLSPPSPPSSRSVPIVPHPHPPTPLHPACLLLRAHPHHHAHHPAKQFHLGLAQRIAADRDPFRCSRKHTKGL